MKTSELRILRAVVELPGRTLVHQPRAGIWALGPERDKPARARWQTFESLRQQGLIGITHGFAMATYVEATDAGRQAVSERTPNRRIRSRPSRQDDRVLKPPKGT